MGGTSHNLLIKVQKLYPFFKKLLPYNLYVILPLLAFIVFCFSSVSFSQIPPFTSTNRINSISSPPSQDISREIIGPCDYSNGEWVPDRSASLYNDSSCGTIKRGRNCVAFGRPDKDYLHWRWKPEKCELPRFLPKLFLKLLKNKHIAFVGDSLARNQLESLLCMISSVSNPELVYQFGGDHEFQKWYFSSYNVTVFVYWSPFLVKGVEKNSKKNFNTLYLDLVDESWALDLNHIDILVLSVGNWFLHQAMLYYQGSLLGCRLTSTPNCSEIGYSEVYGKVLKTTFQTIIQRKGTITVFLTTYSPAHFDAAWDKFGACPKTEPFKGSEVVFDGMNAEMRRIGLEEVEKANLEFGVNHSGVSFEALDITKLAFLRPDGHPGAYGHPFPFANGTKERVYNDCMHWCLPGPIDTWNEILLDVIIKKWGG